MQIFESNPVQRVKEFKFAIKRADAILMVTPEYNFSFSGVLKNAIDSGSRPFGDNSFDRKPVAVMNASTGMLGGARAQYHLRQVFVFLNMYLVNGPDVLVGTAKDRFDANGRLIDENSRRFVKQLLQNLVEWTKKLQTVGLARKRDLPVT